MVSTIARVLSIVALTALSAACKKSPPEVTTTTEPKPDAAATASSAQATANFEDSARRALAEIEQQETTKDVTCWTSFRQLDSFISSREYSNFATLAKITAVKSLLRGAWEKASRETADASVSAASLAASVKIDAATMSAPRQRALSSFATDLGMRAYKDYRTTSEHWRLVLSVLEDEIYADAHPQPLKPLAADALPALAELATRISLLVLESAGQLAQDERSPMIEGAHVKRAFATLAKDYGLANTPERPQFLAAPAAVEHLGPLTLKLIDAKIHALQTFNKDSKDLVTDLNRIAKVPVTKEAVDVWMKDLQSFTHFVAGGYEPMQADNFLADGSFAPSNQTRVPYVDAARAENTTIQLFPHVIMPNGDVKIRFEPNPGAPGDRPRKAQDELMLDYQQNAIRDTAVHWLVMKKVYEEKPFAMDPFAAEYVSEVVSMMMTHYLIRSEKNAKAQGKTSIDAAVAKSVREPDYVMVMPQSQEAKTWSPEQWKKKTALLAGYPAALFRNATADSGLPTTAPKLPGAPADSANASGQFDIQRAMGAGIAVGDVDNDGYPDLFLAGEGAGRLYVNRGKEAPGKYRDASDAYGVPAGLDDSKGALFFDIEGDGNLDLLIVRSEHPSIVLRQDKPGHFADVTEKLGLHTHRGAQVASVFDYDKDGDLDLYMAYYGSDASNRQGSSKRNLPSMDGRNGSPHELWKMGPDGRFTEVGAAAGVADVGWTLATSTFDYDNDGDADLFLANDFGPDVFYRNRGDGTFEDVSAATDTADRGSGMNVSVTDVNGDGWLDLYVSNIDMFSKSIKVVFPTDNTTISTMDEKLQHAFQYIAGNKLFVNPADKNGKTPFRAEQGARFEPGDRGWGWAAVFFDYENDGDEDMYLSTGWLESSFASNQKKQMFLVDEGTFYLAPPASPEALASNGRSAVAVDVDRDGDLDLVLNNFRQAPAVFENTEAAGNHAVLVRLRGAGPNVAAIGARVTASAGGKKMMREVSGGNGYLGQNDDVVSIGIGKASEADVTVRWPSGVEQLFSHVKAGSPTELRQGAGK